jgi:hypothetical protein
MTTDNVRTAVRLVMNLIPEHGVDETMIREAADQVATLLKARNIVVDPAEVSRQVEALAVVHQDIGVSLVDSKGHEEWLRDRRSSIVWNFWNRYRLYLEDDQLLPRQVVLRLDEVTDSILDKLEAPDRHGPWDRRGLVVGQVQSGKTGNYTGLITKAADAGYKLIVVLAGVHNSLRSQTQLRLDEGFLGFDSQYQTRNDDHSEGHAIGAGRNPSLRRLPAGSLTTSAENGDFRVAQARKLALPIGDYPVLLVVKKHARIIGYIRDWVAGMHGEVDPRTGRTKVRDIPLLLIDDEADNASIDTNKEEAGEPTAINRAIRRLLHTFDKSAYVGYTATPFANIYADPYEDHDDYGEDIFPRSFIETLRAPTNYLGPERMFGLSGESGALPIHVAIDDYADWIPDRHKKDWEPPANAFPRTLRQAIHDFILTSAARRARGQVSVHNSMLIHVTRFQAVQAIVHEQVAEELLFIRDRLRHGDEGSEHPIRDQLRKRWRDSYVPTTETFSTEDPSTEAVDWGDVDAELLPAVEKIHVRTVNGTARDALDYYEQRTTGLSVIAIGGDKLSRGLTLEGLSISYYLRASRMYDTLMQMGRWFGYRPRYEDLCRLYTTPELRAWYREITQATDELRGELEEMAAQKATPIQYGLRVRTSPAGLTVTAANKMRRAQRVRLSFSGGNPETVLFDVRARVLDRNAEALSHLIDSAERDGVYKEARSGNHSWTGDLAESVITFFETYQADPMAWRVRPDLIAQYVRRCLSAGELDTWTLLLVSNSSATERYTVAGREIGLTVRSLIDDSDSGHRQRELELEHRYAIRRILNPPDELTGLSNDQVEEAFRLTVDEYAGRGADGSKPVTLPNGPSIRRVRDPRHGLLMIYVLDKSSYQKWISRPLVGFALSLPFSRVDVAAEYAVNPVWQRLQAEGLVFEDDDE